MKKKIIIVASVVVVAILWLIIKPQQLMFAPTSTNIPEEQTADVSGKENTAAEPAILAADLSVPWGIASLSDGSLLGTERTGALLHIAPDGTINRIAVPDVLSTGEGGLLGLALHPDYAENDLLYLYLTTRIDGGTINRVVRYRFLEGVLDQSRTIIDNIPGARYHDGGAIAVGPDQKLYITTGDAGEPDSAQNLNALSGKILRLNLDGTIPADNPSSESPVYSYGHRNPQGLVWDDSEQLWSTEHGRSGVRSGYDELNRIIAGGNYGWPIVQGDEIADDMITPVLHSGPDDTWAPASLAFVNGTFYWGGLRGSALYAADKVGNNSVDNLRMYYRKEFGRLRAVVPSFDYQSLLITTSNTDGRGNPENSDDRIIEIPLHLLE